MQGNTIKVEESAPKTEVFLNTYPRDMSTRELVEELEKISGYKIVKHSKERDHLVLNFANFRAADRALDKINKSTVDVSYHNCVKYVFARYCC